MPRLRSVASLLVFAFPPLCSHAHGQKSTPPAAAKPLSSSECPWLTAGTAAHALDGAVRVTVSLKDKSQSVCTFSTLDTPHGELKIFVGGSDLPSCPKGSAALAGIGTHAYLCSGNSTQRESQLQVSGAVREKAFVVVMRKEAGSSVGISNGPTAETLKEVAEIVAGSLF